ncbi:MAG TPA: hypothetical protein DEO86_07170 [Colwellia sp.]|nr:hypothetical protein [Colwellia sp.]|tara:strand:+ start:3756 stop:4460 length:705 start_codon:yes stop_codon:yes gene_type:complete
MKKTIQKSIALAGLLASFSSPLMAVEFAGQVTLTNDFRFHGISLTRGKEALQGQVTAIFDNGTYAGVWASNLDVGDNSKVEVDYYAGYAGSFKDVKYDATLIHFAFPGYDIDRDYTKLYLGFHYNKFTVLYQAAPDYLNSGEFGQYIGLEYKQPLNEHVLLTLHGGYSSGKFWNALFPTGAYADYSIALSGKVGKTNVSVTYVTNSNMADTSEVFSDDLFLSDDALLFSMSYPF